MKILSCASSTIAFVFSSSILYAAECPVCKPGTAPLAPCKIQFDSGSIGMPTTKLQVCNVSVIAPYGETSSEACRGTIGDEYALVGAEVQETSSNNGSYNLSSYVGGTKLSYKEKIEEAYDEAIDIAVKSGDQNLAAKLRTAKKKHLDAALNYDTNKDTVELRVTASGHGWELDRKRGWEYANAIAEVKCVAPANLSEQIRAEYKITKDFVSVSNQMLSPFFISYFVSKDPAEACSVKSGMPVVQLSSGDTFGIRVPQENSVTGKVCLSYSGHKEFKYANGLCEQKSGDELNVSILPARCSE